MSSYIALSVIFIGISVSLYIWLWIVGKQRTKKLVNRKQRLIQEIAGLSSLNTSEIEAISRAYNTGMMSLDEAADALFPVPSFAIKIVPTRPKYCSGCKYYYGDRGIVCAVHPGGVESDTCLDFET